MHVRARFVWASLLAFSAVAVACADEASPPRSGQAAGGPAPQVHSPGQSAQNAQVPRPAIVGPEVGTSAYHVLLDEAAYTDERWAARVHDPAAIAALAGRVSIDERVGVPSVFWLDADARPLATTPFGAPGATLTGAPLAAAELIAHARGVLVGERDLYGLPVEVIDAAVGTVVHDTGRGPVIVAFSQRYDGVALDNSPMRVVYARRDAGLVPTAIFGALSPHLGPDAAPREPALLDATDAALVAFRSAGLAVGIGDLARVDAPDGESRWTVESADWSSRNPLRAFRRAIALPDRVVDGWYVELDVVDGTGSAEGLGVLVDAASGDVLVRRPLIQQEAVTYRVFAFPDGTPLPSPYGKALSPIPAGAGVPFPTEVAPIDITVESTNALGDFWLPDGALETIGNHVDAYGDFSGGNGLDGQDRRASRTTGGAFDAIYDFGAPPLADAEQGDAATVHLFYTINYMHGLFYDHGFDEASGNAQADNFGRGGQDADRMLAEAQDSSGTDNANMFTPTDGSTPRMQMYVYERGAAGIVSAGSDDFVGVPAPLPAAFDVSAEIVATVDATGDPGDACQALTNDVVGKIAFVERGNCTFVEKAQNAEAAGAVGTIVWDVADAGFGGGSLGGFDPGDTTAPVVLLFQDEGASLSAQLPTTGTLRRLPVQDGALDTEIVTHEWAHYLFGRLTDGNANDSNQGGSINEGQADFVAMVVTVRDEDRLVAGNDLFQGVYPSGPYAGRRHYFGSRRAPYSTDPTVFPLTFRHIADDAPLPSFGAPLDPGGANSEVHNAGEIWANVMWEVYAALLNTHPYDTARTRMLDIIVASYKLYPSAVTYTEARDATLAAANAIDPADYRLVWRAFAKRGLGVGALSPDRNSDTHIGVVESFAVGPDFGIAVGEIDDGGGCDPDGFADRGEVVEVAIEVTNGGSWGAECADPASEFFGDCPVVHVRALSPNNPELDRVGVVFPAGDTFPVPELSPNDSATIAVPMRIDAAVGGDALVVSATIEHPALSRSAIGTRALTAHVDVTAAGGTVDVFETTPSVWQPGANATWSLVDRSGDRVWYTPDPAIKVDASLVSPPIDVGPDPFSIALTQAFSFEVGSSAYDGAVVEVTTDGGQTWVDAADFGADPGYNVVIANLETLFGRPASQNNPLADRPAWGASNPSYPASDVYRLEFGTALAGQTVQVRLRMGTDVEVAGEGWTVERVQVLGAVTGPFPQLIAETGPECDGALPPSADAGPDQVVAPGDLVLLDGSASTSPNGGTITYAWTVAGGADVALDLTDPSAPTFVAPSVAATVPIALELVVDDGMASSTPDQVIVVVDPTPGVAENTAPLARLAARPVLAEAGETVVLDASQSTDLDGDALSFTFTQLDGPPGVAPLLTTEDDRASFVAPELPGGATFVFEVVVSDGQRAGVASTTVVVAPAETTIVADDPMVADEPIVVEAPAVADEPGDMGEDAGIMVDTAPEGTLNGGGCECAIVASATERELPLGTGLLAVLLGLCAALRRRRSGTDDEAAE